ncbi:MAG: PilZ domain-containing protein [Porticoccaceae bacterium]|nr:PilZ domain-containing protein [Porticoccaceae bacterium]
MKTLNPKEACLLDIQTLPDKPETERQQAPRPPRTAYTALAKVYDIVNQATIGYIADISTNGFMLFSGLNLPVNQRRLVSVDLPHPNRSLTTIQLGLRVVWSRPDNGNQNLQALGCEIMAIEPAAKLNLLHSSLAYSHKI